MCGKSGTLVIGSRARGLIDSRTGAGAEVAVVAAAEAVAGPGAETEEAEAVVEAGAVNAIAGDVAGAEPEVATTEVVVSAEAEAEAEAWLGEGVLAGWRMTSKAMHQRIAAVRMMFSMWLTEDVQVNRATKLTEAEKGVLSKCALCGQCAGGRRNEHLLFKCTDARVVEVRKEAEAAIERKVGRLMKPGPVKEAIMMPWRLDSQGRPPDIGVVVEVKAAIGNVLGAATPAEGYRRLVGKQEAGRLIAGGSRAGTTGVHHQVHQLEEAAIEEWEKQSSWKGSRRKRVLLEQDDDEEEMEAAPPETEPEADGGPAVSTTGELVAKMCHEKRQMVWKGMSGSCWIDLVQQWRVRQTNMADIERPTQNSDASRTPLKRSL